ncbi:unnamed protein product [Phaedon cochleariae]|uniref:Epsilon-sarcoglycan n=1 Tax=Phaedon cochleariae TaxID=80249 RepID=A0A9P0GPD2_PHACE|nr:unnamed protein product [Phaedon cochleariae]
MIVNLVFLGVCSLATGKEANVLMTEVFAIPLDPGMFNWTFEGVEHQFVYQASLLSAPDLPSWISYVYSDQHHSGFLYGVPPQRNQAEIPLEVIALNKNNYETRVENLNIIISEKLNPARFEVHIKINNLNVEDMFDVERMEALKDVFRKQLWKDSEDDLYVTFLSSALELGARKPLDPTDGEGVVIRLGSESAFSDELIKLQNEIKPLWKVPSCPREFKRTSVERHFRDAGFALDWCSFRLVDKNAAMLIHTNEHLLSTIGNHAHDEIEHWQPVSKWELPKRSYKDELLVSVLVPVLILIVLGLVLSFLLCFHHEGIEDEESEDYFQNLFHICTDCYYDHYIYKRAKHIDDISQEMTQAEALQRANETLRNFSINRESNASPDPHSHTASPSSTVGHGVHCRPSPPPYVRPKFKPEIL